VKNIFKAFAVIICSLIITNSVSAQFTKQDTLRGSNGSGRDWWDVLVYKIYVIPDYDSKSIVGRCEITFKVTKASKSNLMQIDLQQPLLIDSVFLDWKKLKITREGNVCWVDFEKNKFNISTNGGMDQNYKLLVYYHGNPVVAKRPPWDGGWIFTKDAQGRPWMSVACQGLGASVWYPCKDYQGDEPDFGATLTLKIPDTLTAVANGKLFSDATSEKIRQEVWGIRNPINNYNIIPYIGKYVNWKEVYQGEKGELECNYWVLDYNLEKAKEQFKQVPMMLKAFEHWFGPYPFYEDGYKLIDAPHLGMEHQSAVAYGNKYANGYLGRDLSASGWGLKWDFIIVHESGHEWFANNITTLDIADMWVHEGFTNYSETLFTEYYYGKEAGSDYCIGTRKLIKNDKPIIGPYGVNKEGSGDMYYKGGNLLHLVRQIINNDSTFRAILRGLNTTFYHKTVTTKDVEDYISRQSGIDLSKVFDQYLRTTQIPVLEYSIKGKDLKFRFTNCIKGFGIPVKVKWGNEEKWIRANEEWTIISGNSNTGNFIVDKNFYINVKKVS
jgi:aminopeptidase N